MTAIVFGSSGGIGRALVTALLERGEYSRVFAVSRTGADIDGATPLVADITNESSLAKVATEIKSVGPLRLCIVASGVLSNAQGLSPEKSWRDVSLDAFETVFRVNTFGPALVAKHMLTLMPRKDRAVFAALSARVGSISDNRLGGWHAYRASKAALNMMIKTIAIEQARRNDQFIAVGLHPGTVDTELSKPFQRNVPDGKLFSPKQSARYLVDVISGLQPKATGRVFDWAGKEIEP